MVSAQTLADAERRLVAGWAAECADRALPIFEAESDDGRPRDAIARARAYARGELDAAGEIRRRFEAGRAARAVASPAAVAAARSAAQAAGVAHMGAHALGAAAYAVRAAQLAERAAETAAETRSREVAWQLARMSAPVRDALRALPPLGSDPAGPLGRGMLASGELGRIIRELQAGIAR